MPTAGPALSGLFQAGQKSSGRAQLVQDVSELSRLNPRGEHNLLPEGGERVAARTTPLPSTKGEAPTTRHAETSSVLSR
jgi:hypothetical protein